MADIPNYLDPGSPANKGLPTISPNLPPATPVSPLDAALTPNPYQVPDTSGLTYAPQSSVNWPENSGVEMYKQAVQNAANGNSSFNPNQQQNGALNPSAQNIPSVDQLDSGRPQPGNPAQQNPALNHPDFLAGLQKITEDFTNQYTAKQDVAEKLGNIAAKVEEKKVDFYKQQANASKSAESKVKDAFDTANQKVEQQMQERQKALDEYKEMLTPEKVNEAFRPHGVFEGKSTGQSILGAIAIGLGGIGAAAQGQGSTNQALGLIMRQLDKENEGRQNAYKTQLSGQQNIADEATKSANLYRQVGKDTADNIIQRRALQLETIQAKIEQMAAPYKGQVAQLNAKAMIAGLQQDKDTAKMGFMQQAQQREMMQTLKGLSFEDYDRLNPAIKTMLPEPYVKQMEAIRERTVPGYGEAATKELAQEFNKARPMLDDGIHATQSLIDYTKNYNIFSPSQRATADTKIKALMGPLREPLGMRVLTAPDKDLLEEMIGNPNSILKLNSQKRARLDAVLQIFKDELSARATAAGLKPKSGEAVKQQENAHYGISKTKF